MKYIISTIATLLLFASTQAQGDFTLHLDKSFYVVGEVIWYKLYLPTAQDATVQVVISDDQAKQLDNFFLKSEGKSYVEGYFKVPYSYESGLYRMSFFSTTNPATLIIDPIIPIYNDLGALEISNTQSAISYNEQLEAGALDIDIQLNNSTSYSTRSEIEANITVKDSNGNPVRGTLSVAVVDDALGGEGVVVKSNNTVGNIGNEIIYTGTLRNEAGEPDKAAILGLYSRNEQRIHYSKANPAGKFLFSLPDFYAQNSAQFLGYQFEHQKISISLDELAVAPIEKELVYTDEVIEYLKLSRQRKKIFQINKTFETNLVTEDFENDVQKLKPGFSYIISEYQSFDFMYSFFGELITPLKFELGKDSLFTSKLINPSGRFSANTVLSGPPLFIIDGKATRDADYVARLNMDYIEKVDLFYKSEELRRQFNAIGSSGVVIITTNLRNVELPEKDLENFFMISGILPKANFPIFEPNEIPKTQPFFRPQLYWNPTTETDRNGKAAVQFYQSDDVSRFKIKVVAQSEDGKVGVAEAFYDVKL